MASIVLLLLLLMPIWSVAWVCQRLGTLTEPTLRRDIAMTPQDSRGFLWERLKARFLIAGMFPLIVGALVPIINLLSLLHEPGINAFNASTFWSEIVFGMAIPVLCLMILPALTGWGILLTASRRACAGNRHLSVWKWGALSCAAGYFVVVLWFAAVAICMNLIDGSDVKKKLFIAGISAVSIAISSSVVRRSWKRFVAAYLEVEGGATPGDPS